MAGRRYRCSLSICLFCRVFLPVSPRRRRTPGRWRTPFASANHRFPLMVRRACPPGTCVMMVAAHSMPPGPGADRPSRPLRTKRRFSPPVPHRAAAMTFRSSARAPRRRPLAHGRPLAWPRPVADRGPSIVPFGAETRLSRNASGPSAARVPRGDAAPGPARDSEDHYGTSTICGDDSRAGKPAPIPIIRCGGASRPREAHTTRKRQRKRRSRGNLFRRRRSADQTQGRWRGEDFESL